jgi:hypothetical protein
MCVWGVPRVLDRFFESRHLYPKLLKTEGFRSPRPIHFGKKEWAMIGQGRGKGMEDVGVEGDVPIFVAKEAI